MAKKEEREERSLPEFEENIIQINRCAKVHKGGRKFSFSALVVIGNRNGTIAYGYGKANEVPPSVDKAIKNAHKKLYTVSVVDETIPHRVTGKYGTCKILLIPAAKGTGVIACKTVRTVLELAGVRNVLTKSFGSNNPVNLVKAVFGALNLLKTKEEVEKLRGITVS
ncbi:MAG: 30S ribosomal protein S5 [Planctomycetota bacterium]